MMVQMWHHGVVILEHRTTIGRALRIFPKDKRISNRPGEDPLNITFVIRLTNFLGHTITAEVGIQVGTVPIPNTQYNVTRTIIGRVDRLIQTNRITLFPFSTISIKLDWLNCCIASTRRDIETCEDFPTYVHYDQSDLLSQADIMIPLLWKTMEITGISTVTIGIGETQHILYSMMTGPTLRNEATVNIPLRGL